jgi:hypothetical protein
VNAYNVPNGPQKFALVVDGGTIGSGGPTTGTLEGTVTDASTSNPISGATVTIVGGASTTTDGSGFYQFTNVAQGTYDVTASATGYDPSTANGVTVTAGNTTIQNFALTPVTSGGTIHVGALSGSSTVRRNNWSATVVVTVHDSGHSPVPNVTVTGDWTGASFNGGSNTCITDGSGQCSVSTGNIKNTSSVTYTVTNLSGTGYTYDAGANEATSITVNQ